jgi:hypothetical protein
MRSRKRLDVYFFAQKSKEAKRANLFQTPTVYEVATWRVFQAKRECVTGDRLLRCLAKKALVACNGKIYLQSSCKIMSLQSSHSFYN